MTPVGRDDSARRTLQGFALRGESLCPQRQRDQNAVGGVPPLRDDKKSVPLRQTGGHRGPPLQRFKDLHKITTKWNRFRGCGGDLYINRPKLPRRGGSQTRPSFSDHDTRRARRPGAPPQRVKPSALHENSPKPGGRGKPLPYEMTGKYPVPEDGRPAGAALIHSSLPENSIRNPSHSAAPLTSGSAAAHRWPTQRHNPIASRLTAILSALLQR